MLVLADERLRLALEVPLEHGLLLAADALLPLAHALHEEARLLNLWVEDEVPALGEGRVRVGVGGRGWGRGWGWGWGWGGGWGLG